MAVEILESESNTEYNPPNYTTPTYTAPVDHNNNQFYDDNGNLQPMSVKDWLITYLLLMIPFANFVFAIIWAIGGENVHPDKTNFFRAYWIFMAICFAAGLLFSAAIISVVGAAIAAKF